MWDFSSCPAVVYLAGSLLGFDCQLGDFKRDSVDANKVILIHCIKSGKPGRLLWREFGHIGRVNRLVGFIFCCVVTSQ